MSEEFATTEINIAPKTNVYSVFRKLNYEQASAYAEFIDNSTQSFFNHESELMEEPGYPGCIIDINHDPVKQIITISDNCYGMELDDFKRAVILNSVPDDTSGRNEYGMGLKTAATWFGNKWSVRTTQKGSNYEYVTSIDIKILSKFMPEKVSAQINQVPRDNHYTIITIEELNRSYPQKKALFALRQALGQVYCRDIQNGKVRIRYNGEEIEYKYPEILLTKDQDGKEKQWKTNLEFKVDYNGKVYPVHGFAALRSKGSQKHAGFMLFRRNRAVIGGFGEKYKPVEIFGLGNSFRSQRLFGEFDLDDWPVTQTKDHFDWEPELEHLLIDGIDSRIKDLEQKADNYRVRKQVSTPNDDVVDSKFKSVAEKYKDQDDKPKDKVLEIKQDPIPFNPIPPVLTSESNSDKVTQTACSADESSGDNNIPKQPDDFICQVDYLGDVYSFYIKFKEIKSDILFSKSTQGNNITVYVNTFHQFYKNSTVTEQSADVFFDFIVYLCLSEKIVDLDSVDGSISSSSIRNYINVVSKFDIKRS